MLKYLQAICLLVITLSCLNSYNWNVEGAEPPSAVGSMLNLLKSGRVPESRLGTIVKLICDRGNEHDLRFIFDQIVSSEDWSNELRASALEQLSAASTSRNIIPAGALTEIARLFDSKDRVIRKTAIKLAGQWHVDSAFAALNEISRDNHIAPEDRTAALLSMARISPEKTESLLIELSEKGSTFPQRANAVNILAMINLKTAASVGAKVLAEAAERDDPSLIVDGFLNQEGGSQVLAAAVEKVPTTADIAKLALRHMYSIGRTDQELSAVLSKIAGIAGDPKPPTKEELAALVEEVNRSGDAARGEEVFRRNDLSCMKCHAVSKAGGQIGPDLSAIGASSPVEYVIMSVLDPDQAIKEAYTTRVVITTEGRIHQGLVADRTANALVLKDATGQETSIPISDIDDEVEGKSLMPKGLVKFMTHAEFVDLAKFLSALGKPGTYAVRSTQRMQRWKLLTEVPQSLIEEIPTLSSFEDLVLRSNSWLSVYARVNGELPLTELTNQTSQPIVYVRGEINVSRGGVVQGHLNSAMGVTVWMDDEILSGEEIFEKELTAGLHTVTLRIDTTQRDAQTVKLEFSRSDQSPAEFAVVDGQ